MSDVVLTPEAAARISKAIADPQRFAILTTIARSDEIACKTLVSQFSITQATISHHLKELVAAALIESRREGQLAMLRCRRDVCDAYLQMLAEQLDLNVTSAMASPTGSGSANSGASHSDVQWNKSSFSESDPC